MGDMADYYGDDIAIDNMARELDAIEAEEALARVAEHERMHNRRMVDLLTTPRVSQARLRLLDQDEVWVNKAGDTVPLAQIDARYAENICNWLLRGALAFKNANDAFWLTTPMPNGDMALLDVENMMGEAFEKKPEDLIRESVLYQALDRIVHKGDT